MNISPEVVISGHSKSKNELEKSFTVFTELASDLTNAYQELEDRVSLLTSKLEHVTQERLQELTEKELIANRLEKLLIMLPTSVVVIDGKGIVQDCNPAAKELLGTELIGVSWRRIIKEVFAPKEDDGCEVSLKDGKRISIAIKALSEEPGQIVVMNDLSQTRALQEQIARDKSLKEMGKMVASLAHQIRTPLTTAMLYTSQIIDNELDKNQLMQSASKLKARLENIEHQVKDMLLYAKGGHLQLQPETISHLVTEFNNTCKDQFPHGNPKIIIENNCPDSKISCHRETLIGAFTNIVNNAVESSPEIVTITMHVTQIDEDNVLFVIQDNGPGIEKELIGQVTQPFFTTRPNGTGLGLDIVRAIVAEHNGRFSLDSTVGVGTRISLFFPCLSHK